MHIAHVVRQYYPSVGGFEEVVKNLCKHQLLTGHTPYVITLDRYFKALDKKLPETEVIENIQVIRIPFMGSTRYPIALSVLKYIKDADVVHVHAIDFFYDFLALTKFVHKKKMLASTHGGFFHTSYASTFKKFFFNTVTRFSSLFYHKVIASSENDAKIFKSIVTAEKLITIENGVDIEKLHVEKKTEFPPTLLYFGRWSENKGIFESLDLFKQLTVLDQSVDWRFILAGRPYDITMQNIEARISSLGLNHKVDIVENPDIRSLRALTLKATYFISMSKFEGFGIAPIEALSAGLWPILSPIPPFIKLVKQTCVGTIIADNDESEVRLLIEHYKQLNQSCDAKNVDLKAYDWVTTSRKYMLSYK